MVFKEPSAWMQQIHTQLRLYSYEVVLNKIASKLFKECWQLLKIFFQPVLYFLLQPSTLKFPQIPSHPLKYFPWMRDHRCSALIPTHRPPSRGPYPSSSSVRSSRIASTCPTPRATPTPPSPAPSDRSPTPLLPPPQPPPLFTSSSLYSFSLRVIASNPSAAFFYPLSAKCHQMTISS